MKNIRKHPREILIFPLAILSISTAAIFIRFAQETVPSITIAAYRMALASLILLPFSFKKAVVDLRELRGKGLSQLVLSGFLLAAHFASWIISLEFTNVLSSVVLVTTTPIWVSLLSPLLFKEKITEEFWLGLAIAFIGILVVAGIVLNGGRLIADLTNPAVPLIEGLAGNLLALAGAFFAAGYVVIGRRLRKDVSTRTYTFSVYSIAAFFLIVFAVFFHP